MSIQKFDVYEHANAIIVLIERGLTTVSDGYLWEVWNSTAAANEKPTVTEADLRQMKLVLRVGDTRQVKSNEKKLYSYEGWNLYNQLPAVSHMPDGKPWTWNHGIVDFLNNTNEFETHRGPATDTKKNIMGSVRKYDVYRHGNTIVVALDRHNENVHSWHIWNSTVTENNGHSSVTEKNLEALELVLRVDDKRQRIGGSAAPRGPFYTYKGWAVDDNLNLPLVSNLDEPSSPRPRKSRSGGWAEIWAWKEGIIDFLGNTVALDMSRPSTKEFETHLLNRHTGKPVKAVSSPIAEALRQKIIELTTTGDANRGGIFTASVAAQIERLVHAGREILLAEGLPLDGLKSLMKGKRRRRGMGGLMPGGMVTNLTDLDDMGIMDGADDMLMSEDYGGYEQMGMGNGRENFGVHAIKELVSTMSQANSSPAKDVEALILAKKEGLTEVVAALEAKLGIRKPKELPGFGPRGDAPTDALVDGKVEPYREGHIATSLSLDDEPSLDGTPEPHDDGETIIVGG